MADNFQKSGAKKRKRPGPYKFTDLRKGQYLARLAKGERRTLAAKAMRINYSTVLDHIATDEDFAAAVIEAESQADLIIENALFETAKDGNVTAQQVWLYNRKPESWRDKRNIEHTGRDGAPIVFELDMGKMNGDQDEG